MLASMIEFGNELVGWGMVVVGWIGSMGGLVSGFILCYLLMTRGR